ncbi:hypothetical protein [Hyphomicrobium sp.]|uniref:hypothetical protein n=1 Tax=Hyphomicrobium sp. TaxID=82 RepID=UPI002CE4EE3A|nr:hypothetical protein [Hyphomicrobium sp.]HRQ25803.1 hypothetical protein [Hyphomicrobium sp.]
MIWLTIALLTFLVIALFAGHGAHERRIEALEQEIEARKLSLPGDVVNIIRDVQARKTI